jgi:superfamily II DNA or RNA helicase
LFNVFKKSIKNYSYNLISSDGNRDIETILNNKKEKNIYSVTFYSADIILELIDNLDNIILIVDEFHNLSYSNVTNKNNAINKIILSDKITKKIFMSATPKVYEIKKEDDVIEHSVDNYKNIFGEIFYSYDFKKAIENKYINDYQLIFPNDENEKNKYNFIYSNMLYHGYKKCLIYCQNIEEAQKFEIELRQINKFKFNFKIYLKTITYKTSLKKRNKILNEFLKDEYKLSLIISIHTLDECIDIPKCDSIYISYHVKNPINIIQRISRCLRIYPNKIKSGIFIWCEKYNELKKINNIIKNYDINILNKIYIYNNTNNNNTNNNTNNNNNTNKTNNNTNNKTNNKTNTYNNTNNNTNNNKILELENILVDNIINNNKNNDKILELENILIDKNIIDNNNIIELTKKINISIIPEKFIKDYCIFSHCNFISIVEFIKWIDINRKSMIENLKKNYKKNIDYYITTMNDELECIKIYKKDSLTFKPNQKYIKITYKCFKDICINSSSSIGKLFRKYYSELDEFINKKNNI